VVPSVPFTDGFLAKRSTQRGAHPRPSFPASSPRSAVDKRHRGHTVLHANVASVTRSDVSEEPPNELKAVLVLSGGGFSLRPRALNKSLGGGQGGADGTQAQEKRGAVPHVLHHRSRITHCITTLAFSTVILADLPPLPSDEIAVTVIGEIMRKLVARVGPLQT
jgi:hypothetical protein